MLQARDLDVDVLNSLTTERIWEVGKLLEFLTRLAKADRNESSNMRLLVIDSIAGPLRSEFESDQRKERFQVLHRIGYLLNAISRKYNIPVVVTNQVNLLYFCDYNFDTELDIFLWQVSALIDQKQESFGRNVVPCFGLAWSGYIHSRIFIARTDNIINKSEPSSSANSKKVKIETRLRTATVDISPVLPNETTFFIVEEAGVRGVTIKK